jgi:glycosyltransferase involved in cell wall biosynthesis
MGRPLITVIVPTRNRHHLLPRALESLYSQTLGDFEIILVDDNAPENRVANEPSLANLLQDPRLRIVEHDHPRNAASARNCGLRISRGEWITYLDDDDAYQSTKLERQLHAAQKTGLPLGLCGMAVNLVGRRRLRQIEHESFSGDKILLDVLADTKVIFHRNAATVFFNESLDAAEDAYFFLSLVRHFGTDRVFNVPEALVEVFPQSGARVNLNGPALWQTNRAIFQDFGAAFGERAANIYLARAEMQCCKFEDGNWPELIRRAARLLRLNGVGELRTIANTALFKFPPARRFLVS